MKSKQIFFIIILFLSIFTRFFHLGTLPPSLYYDEVDGGYQAYVLNSNQTDYYGNKFPIHFRSFGDFRSSPYIYVVSVIQKIIPNPDISFRLPAAMFGVGIVILIYFITGSLIPSFLFSISPWAIHYSRFGFDVTLLLLFILLGIYFWIKFLQNKNVFHLSLSIISFCFTPYIYSTAKLFLIFIGISIFLLSYRQIIALGYKKITFLTLLGVLCLIPMASETLKGKAGYRFNYISIFTLPHREQITDNARFEDAVGDHPNQVGLKTNPLSMLLHNKYQIVAQKFVSNYLSSFSTDFLFLYGDSNPRHGFTSYGLVYLLDGIFIIVGVFSIGKTSNKNKLSQLFLMLLIFSPIPSALTRDSQGPHATRLILMLPSIIYFSCLGIQKATHKHPKAFLVIVTLYFFSFLDFWHYYNYHYPQQTAMSWNTGMKEAVLATNNYNDSTLVFSDSNTSFVSFFLYYHPYQLPKDDSLMSHLLIHETNSFSGQKLDRQYYFGRINWTNLSEFPQNTIFIVPKSEYLANHLDYLKTLSLIPKKYSNQEEFLLLSRQNQ